MTDKKLVQFTYNELDELDDLFKDILKNSSVNTFKDLLNDAFGEYPEAEKQQIAHRVRQFGTKLEEIFPDIDAGNPPKFPFSKNDAEYVSKTIQAVDYDILRDAGWEESNLKNLLNAREKINGVFLELSNSDISQKSAQSAPSVANGKIKVYCVKEQGKLRNNVSPSQQGFNHSYNIQFPKDLRTEGKEFLVDGLKDVNGFYRVDGSIWDETGNKKVVF